MQNGKRISVAVDSDGHMPAIALHCLNDATQAAGIYDVTITVDGLVDGTPHKG